MKELNEIIITKEMDIKSKFTKERKNVLRYTHNHETMCFKPFFSNIHIIMKSLKQSKTKIEVEKYIQNSNIEVEKY